MPATGTRLDLDPFEFVNREKLLTGSVYGSEDPAAALPRLLEDVAGGGLRLAPLVGPSYPLEQADEAVQAALSASTARVLVTMQGS
jgi:Zn-dependent alcohol dehydrogenase